MGSSVLDTARTEIPTKAERTMYRLAYRRLEFLERVLWVCLPVGAALAVPVTLQFGLTLSAYLLVGAGLGLLIGGVAHLVVSLSMWINRQQFETLYRYAQLSKIPFRSPAMSRTPGAQVKKQTVLLLLGAAALFITGFHALQSGLEGL
jgi:hypothetical protein